MDYNLAKQLKEAGYPQTYKGGTWACEHGLDWDKPAGCKCYGSMLTYSPNLSELIEACGDFPSQFSLYGRDKDRWEATLIDMNLEGQNHIYYGSTPEEAVSNLWLALHKK